MLPGIIPPNIIKMMEEFSRRPISGLDADQLRYAAHEWLVSRQIPLLYDFITNIELDTIQNHAVDLIKMLEYTASCFQDMLSMLQSLHDRMRTQEKPLAPADQLAIESLQHRFSISVTASLCKMAPKNFPSVLHALYALGLPPISEDQQHGNDDYENKDLNTVSEKSRLDPGMIASTSISLSVLGLSEAVIKVASAVVKSHIKKYLQHACDELSMDSMKDNDDDDMSNSVLKQGLSYVDTIPLEYLKVVIVPPCLTAATDNVFIGKMKMSTSVAHKWRDTLRSFVYEELAKLHTSALFNLVIDYPDSLPTLLDLRECLQYTDGYTPLVDTFGTAIKTRLLHPGAATTDILQHYTSTIRALQHVDPSGAVLDAVSAPLREYLRTRKDAIRCIITLLTEDGDGSENASFLAELAAANEESWQGNGSTDEDFCKLDADEKALVEATKWQPGPLAVAPLQLSGGVSHSMDVISLLVNIYGTKELFVSEYKSMLADRLLARTDFDADRDVRTLELLKLRFGDAALHAAEVMLRDMADSKRINTNVQTISNTSTPLKRVQDSLVPLQGLGVTIVSQLFWPPMQQEEFTLPREVQAMLRTFGHKYHAIKAPRVLQWKPNLGSVELTLTIGATSLDFWVSPMLATLILSFQKQSEWTAKELADELNVSTDVIRKKMLFWLNQGIVSTDNTSRDGSNIVYRRNEELQKGLGMHDGDATGTALMDDIDGERGQESDAMAHLEPFVIGMLTNFDSLPLDRIHNMLKMFATDPPYNRTIEQLSSFMSKLSTEDKVVLEGGLYKRRG